MSINTDSRGDSPLEGDEDPLYQQALEIVLKQRSGSVSLVQRHLRLGYARAAQLLARMEAEGVLTSIRENGLRELVNQNASQDQANPEDEHETVKAAHRAVVVLKFLSLTAATKKVP